MPAPTKKSPQQEAQVVSPESGERIRETAREEDTAAQDVLPVAHVAAPDVPLARSVRPPAVAATLRPGVAPEHHAMAASLSESLRRGNSSSPKIQDTSGEAEFDAFSAPHSIRHTSSEVPPSHVAPEPGQYVGRYLIEEVLGRGGMGLVLRARDDLLQRHVAIKIILPQYLAADPAAGLRFLREAEIVARLQHPHIIRVLDAGLDRGVAFLAFEYIEGRTFTAFKDRGPLSPIQAVDLILPVISAVSTAHHLGVVHGDLKPSNLIVSEDYAGRPHPWVLDFGVSFFSEVEAGLDPMRRRITGTPGYMAPEWLDHHGVDGRADCFSLGCVLYELLAGKGPFAGSTRLSEAAAAARSRDYPHLKEVSHASDELVACVEQALAPHPVERYSSARSFGRALIRFASDELRMHYAAEFESRH